MDSTIEHIEGGNVRLTVTIPGADVDAAIGAAYADIAKKVNIPGFRKGKAPRQIIDQYVGRETVLAEAAEAVVMRAYPQSVEDHALLTAGRGDIGELDVVEPGMDFTFTAEVPVRPELTLNQIDGFVVTAPNAEASDAEIDAQIDYLRDRFATLDSVEDAVAADDFALISFVGKVGGEDYEGNTVDSYLYELGRGQMPPEFDTALIGAKAGQSVTAAFAIPDTSSNQEFVGKEATFDVTVYEVKRKRMPPVDDEFAGNVGFDTIAELREDIRTKLDENKKAGRVAHIEQAARAAVTAVVEGDVPEELVKNRAEELYEEFFENLGKRGITPEQYVEATGVTPEHIQGDISEQAAHVVREELALEALARAHGMAVTASDVDEEVERMASAVESKADDVRDRLMRAGMLPAMREQLIHRFAIRWLMDNVTITDEPAPATDAAE